MSVDVAEIIAIQRSAAMLPPGGKLPVHRDQLIDLCDELLQYRQLLTRLGGDLRTVAAHATTRQPEPRRATRHN